MNVGDLVASRYPKMYSHGYGIILKVRTFKAKRRPSQYKVFWFDEKRITMCKAIELGLEEELTHEEALCSESR